MKRILNCLSLLSSVLIFQTNALAQKKSELKLYDLNPGVEIPDSTTSKEGKYKLYVNFKLSDVSIADSIFFTFGTTKEGKEVITEVGEFKKVGSVYSIKTQGPTFSVKNSEVTCRIKITKKQLQACKFLSLVVKDKSGLYSNVVSTRIN